MFCLLPRRSREPGGRGYVRGVAYGSVSGAHAKDTDILGCSINKDYAGMCVCVSVCLGFSDTGGMFLEKDAGTDFGGRGPGEVL